MSRRFFATLATPILIAALVGCGSNDDPADAPVPENAEPPPVQVVEKDEAPPVPIKEKDPRMAAAIAEARATVRQFIAALTNPTPSQSAFSVKVAVTDGDQVEHIWLAPVRYENGKFSGRVTQAPLKVTTVGFGDELDVAANALSDWMYADEALEQQLVGGYTVRVLRELSLQQQGDTPAAGVGDHELIGRWTLISIDSGEGPRAKEGFHLDLTGATITFVAPNGTTNTMGQLHRIDPATQPKQLDLQNGDNIAFGIYHLEGDTLKLLVRDPGSDRPTEFKGARDGMLFILERD